MTDQLRNINQRGAGFKLLNNEGVSEVIDLGITNSSQTEIAVDGCPDIATRRAGRFWSENGLFARAGPPDNPSGFLAGIVKRHLTGFTGV